MANFKKIDWLRQLYHEATRWQHDLKGQISWKGLKDVKDPNNGSKFTMAQLLSKLAEMLRPCVDQSLVPFEYVAEVSKCLAHIEKGEKFNNKAIAKLAYIRKVAISLYEYFVNFAGLSDVQRTLVVKKLCEDQIISLRLATRRLAAGIKTVPECPDIPTAEKAKQFKLIDWLRHIYLSCQKWMNDKQGQLQWKGLEAKDPNNSKTGSRMKIDELKESLQVLVPQCLENGLVPKEYLGELQILSHNFDVPMSKELELEEQLRKMAVKCKEVLPGLDEVFEDVLATLAPQKLAFIKSMVAILEKTLRTHLDEDEEEERCLQCNTLVTETNQREGYISEENFDNFTAVELVDDGTNALMEILEQAEIPPNPSTTDEDDLLTSDPLSVSDASHPYSIPSFPILSFPLSPESEVFSEMSAPSSPEALTGDISDDSGIYSPGFALEEDLDIGDLDDSIYQNLDVSELPDTAQYLLNSEDNEDENELIYVLKPDLKRKRVNDFETPVAKRINR